MWVAKGHFYQITPKTTEYIVCMLDWAQATFVKGSKIQSWQELGFILAAISKIESREKA